MGNVLGDFRYALRSLARQPTFAGVAILTLVLGIGLNTAIFSVIKAVLLNQLPYQDPSRLVVLWEQSPTGTTDLVAPLTFVDWQEQSLAVRSMAAFRQLRYAFAGNGEPLDVPSVKATPGLFAMLRVNAMLGRTFLPEDGTPGAGRVATTYPDSNTGWGARVIAAQEQLVTTVRPALLMISGAVGFLLLIVCANVANLILARLSSRRGEIAVRAALGAGRLQLVCQVM